jgi:hypothetical protein
MTTNFANKIQERKFKLLSVLAMMLIALTAIAQPKDLAYYQCAFSESYRQGDVSPWPKLIAEMEAVRSTDLAWQIELVKALYGLIGYELGAKNKNLARVYVMKVDDYLGKLLDKYPGNAQLHAIDGAVYGYKIALSPYKAPFLGPKSMWHVEKAIALDSNNPAGYIEKGNSLQYRPAVFGGDKEEALRNYQKALKLMETRGEVKCNWQHLLVQAFILKSLYELKRTQEAQAFLESLKKDYGSMDWIKKFVGMKYFEEK